MKSKYYSFRSLFPTVAITAFGGLAGGSLQAADGIFIKTDAGSGSWVTTGWWQDGIVPGSTSITNSPDIANFPGTLTVNRAVTVDANRNLFGIRLGGNNTNFNYAFNGGTTGSFIVSAGGFIELDDTATSGNHRELINAPITLMGDATFSNNATGASRSLRIQTVNGAAALDETHTLTLNGSNTSLLNELNNPIGDGANGGQLALTKGGAGTWTLSGTSTYTGATTVSAGTMLVNGSLGETAVSVGANGTIGGTGLLAGSLAFDGDSTLTVVNLADALAIAGSVTFGSGFGINNLAGINWDTISLGAHTILDNNTDFSLAGLDNFGFGNAIVVGTLGREAYFQSGSLQVVVIPEPNVAILIGSIGALSLIRRRRI